MDNRVGFILSDDLIQWGHREQQIKDSSCSQQWNTSWNNDNSDDREQAVYWLNTKDTLTGCTKWSISSCYHCLIVSICQFQRTEECVCEYVCVYVCACVCTKITVQWHLLLYIICILEWMWAYALVLPPVCMSVFSYLYTCLTNLNLFRVCMCMSLYITMQIVNRQRITCSIRSSLAVAVRTAWWSLTSLQCQLCTF